MLRYKNLSDESILLDDFKLSFFKMKDFISFLTSKSNEEKPSEFE